MKTKMKKLTLGTLTAMSALSSLKAEALQMPWDRKAVVITYLAANGKPELRWLYQFLEGAGIVMTLGLSPQYKNISVLAGEEASSANLRRVHKRIGEREPEIRAVDTFIYLHGSPNELHFQNGGVRMSRLEELYRNDITSMGRRKLRALYSTACYGNTHSDEFRNIGFNVSSGSRAVNSNSAYELPIFLTRWGTMATYGDAVAAGQNDVIRNATDQAARDRGFSDVDSRRVVSGLSGTKLDSEP